MSLRTSKLSREVETGSSFALLAMLRLYVVSALCVRPCALAAIRVLDGPEVIFFILAGGDGQLSESLSSGVGICDAREAYGGIRLAEFNTFHTFISCRISFWRFYILNRSFIQILQAVWV